jgi:hypothetical protein
VRFGDVVLLVLVAMLLTGRGGASQGAPTDKRVTIHVAVVGSNGSAIRDVNLAVSRVDIGAMLSGRTNDSGLHVFKTSLPPGAYTLLSRSPGFLPGEVRFDVGKSDSVFVTVRLNASPATDLAPVVVEATRSNYLLTRSDMVASGRPIRDAFEALKKLKPSMLYDKDRCRAEVVENVWINGRRVLFMAKEVPILGSSATRSVGAFRVRTSGGGARSEPPAVDSVLASIRAEHVDEIRLINCWDTSLPGVGAKNALYVSLKPGIDWDWIRGSFVADTMLKH